MSTGSDIISASPLIKLFQQPNTLVRLDQEPERGKKRKLRPEVIDMQRTKDVGAAQPVSMVPR